MSDLIVTKINEVYARIECEKSTSQELHDHFSFMVPGYQFVPAYRNKLWNGKIYLYHLNTSQIYLGLLSYVEEFCKSRDYTFEYQDGLDISDEYSVYHAKKFIEELNIHARGESIDVRDYQLEAFIHAMQNRRALLLSPTASGKSLIIYLIFRQLHKYQNLKGLVIVPNTALVEQLYSDFADYNNDSMELYLHRIYQGKEKDTDKPLTISTWQSLYKMPKDYFEQFDYIIGDEAHLFKAQSLTTILTSCINSKYRIGLTGSLDGTKTHKLVLEGLFGPTKKVISTKELIDKKQVSDFEIKCLLLKHDDDICLRMKDTTYQEEIQYLISNENRNKFIKNLAVSLGNNTLILYQMVDKHGKILYDMIKNTKNIGDRKIFFIHGGTDVGDREEVRRIMEFCNENTIFLDFDDYEIMLESNEYVDLINKKQKKAKEIAEDDDIDTSIVINKIQTSILKGYVWTKKN